MAAERCANPAYLSEVNGMMLEYTLYKTIKAHIELFNDLSNSEDSNLNGDDVLSKLKNSSASTLTEIYDSLVHVIQEGQIDPSLKQSLRFDTSLLQMLVLLRTWIGVRLKPGGVLDPQLSAETWASLEAERIINQTYRTLWIHFRSNPSVVLDPDTVIVPEFSLEKQVISLADHVVPRFMQISEEFFSIFQGSSEKWMQLAANLLAQSAIEALTSVSSDLERCREALEICFAWGYVERPRLTSGFEHIVAPLLCSSPKYRDLDATFQAQVLEKAGQKAEVEDRIWEMFFDQGSSNQHPGSSNTANGDTDVLPDKAETTARRTPQSSGELKSWKTMRQHALDDVLLTHTSMLQVNGEPVSDPLQILQERHPLRPLLLQLTDFVANHWTMSHSQNWNGLPVLVQIEEGRLEGLTSEEFELFKQRAGITGMP